MIGRRSESHVLNAATRTKRSWKLELADGSASEADADQECPTEKHHSGRGRNQRRHRGTTSHRSQSEEHDGHNQQEGQGQDRPRQRPRRRYCSPSKQSANDGDMNQACEAGQDRRRRRRCSSSHRARNGKDDNQGYINKSVRDEHGHYNRRRRCSPSQYARDEVAPKRDGRDRRHAVPTLSSRYEGHSTQRSRDVTSDGEQRDRKKYRASSPAQQHRRGTNSTKVDDDFEHQRENRRRTGRHQRYSPSQRSRHDEETHGDSAQKQRLEAVKDVRVREKLSPSRQAASAEHEPRQNGSVDGVEASQKRGRDSPSPRSGHESATKQADSKDSNEQERDAVGDNESQSQQVPQSPKQEKLEQQPKKKKEYAWMESGDEADGSVDEAERASVSPAPPPPSAQDVETLGQMLRLVEHLENQSLQSRADLPPDELVHIIAAAARVKFYDPGLFSDMLAPTLLARFRHGLTPTATDGSKRFTIESTMEIVSSLAALNAASAAPIARVFQAAAKALEEQGTALAVPQRRQLKEVYATAGRENDVAFLEHLASPSDPSAIAAAAFRGSPRHGTNTDGLPMRPGARICDAYAKMGTCRTGSSCKHDHPETLRVIMNSDGYPMRPWAPTCPYYMNMGTCDFRKTCKWHHPDKREGRGPGVSYTCKGSWASK